MSESDPNAVLRTREESSSVDDAQVVYLIPVAGDPSARQEGVDLLELLRILWGGKWLILVIVLVAIAFAVFQALRATEWYSASVVLMPVDDRASSGGASQLGGLASLAGIRIGASSGAAEALAVLRSRDFVRQFIEDEQLLPVMYSDRWDADENRWLDEDGAAPPDLRGAVSYFRNSVLSVEQDSVTRIVTVTVDWTDPELAAEWANSLAERLNSYMRDRALQETGVNVDYLRRQIESATVVALQQSIGRILESELQQQMMAEGAAEFAFRVIDRAEPPRERSRPNRTLIVLASAMAAGMLGAFLVIVTHLVRHHSQSPSSSSGGRY